ncbi:ER degradation-enhancing alpha-mannosidase-like protein 2 isoform X2 [Thalassophryne amazonica]|uniref:ER degradation-enhancing alpha-mannosidase-like protein 2 isoform X2 n=1 Tax=Thalassophryne amazonica TaxID=390379 RepID=UPI0014721B92|nr:ER degradation-enhancing alpha-mannosidase-like protein 2 isoform X2 [Thalassophryne amazonica]XP_034041209.1 ER degradation-enhancing alpha-mannosidase-like protein 2 isoform X2 [Thalassophryne amazonica]
MARTVTCSPRRKWTMPDSALNPCSTTPTTVTLTTPSHMMSSALSPVMDMTHGAVVGGLLSAHLLAGRAGLDLEPGWPCAGPLLRLAEDAARKLLPAFQTPTGMPYGTVNLLHGVSPTETPVTCTAGVGTFILEFATLSRLTGDPTFEDVARRALRALWKTRSDIGLVGNHIDIQSKKWVAQDAGIGAGVDSYFEYLVKGSIMLQDEELLNMFLEYDRAIQNYTRFDDWYLWVQMHKGSVSMPVFQSLEAFWPGLQSLLGNLDSAARTFQNYYSVWRQFGGLPEFYSIPQGYTVDKREGYPLRPELIESAMYLFRATGDHTYLQLGLDALESIEKIAKTPCGYASIKDLRDHQLDNRMESFFLAETVKYLYLLFDPSHFLHGNSVDGTESWEEGGEGGECVLGAGGFIFNTEAHPLDPAALYCCSRHKQDRQELRDILLSLSEPTHKSGSQSQASSKETETEAPPLDQSGSIALKPGERKSAPLLSCPVQPFSSRLSLLGQVFSNNT